MNLGKHTFAIGILGSILLHGAFAFAVVVLVTGKFPGFKGTAGDIFMVSFDTEGSMSGGLTGFPAFSSQPLPTKIKAAPVHRLRNFTPASFALSSAGVGLGTSPRQGATGGGGGTSGLLVALEAPKPPYPPAARRAGFEGRVLLEVQIGPDGLVQAATILESSGREDCDQSARDTIAERWRFRPIQSMEPVRQNIAIRFALE